MAYPAKLLACLLDAKDIPGSNLSPAPLGGGGGGLPRSSGISNEKNILNITKRYKSRSQTTMLVIRIPNNSSMIHTFTNQTVKRGGQKANA